MLRRATRACAGSAVNIDFCLRGFLRIRRNHRLYQAIISFQGLGGKKYSFKVVRFLFVFKTNINWRRKVWRPTSDLRSYRPDLNHRRKTILTQIDVGVLPVQSSHLLC